MASGSAWCVSCRRSTPRMCSPVGTFAGYALALAMNFPAAKLEALVCVAAVKGRSHTLGVAFSVNVITGQIKDMIADVE